MMPGFTAAKIAMGSDGMGRRYSNQIRQMLLPEDYLRLPAKTMTGDFAGDISDAALAPYVWLDVAKAVFR